MNTPTEADRQCAKNILAEFVHTQPPPDFMEDRVTNHIAAHRAHCEAAIKALGENAKVEPTPERIA